MQQSAVMLRLSIMMFLQFFIWGAWYVSMTGFINRAEMGGVTGAAYTVGPLAAIVAPIFLGMVADRFFPTQRVLAVLHLVGGLVLLAAPSMAQPFALEPAPADAGLFHTLVLHDLPAFVQPFTLLLFAHMLCYMPTIGLTTSLALHHLDQPERQFPLVRVLGTFGWIAGNIAVSFLAGKDESAAQFQLAGGCAVLLGFYSFTLPHTPPPAAGRPMSLAQIFGADSLRLLRQPAYFVFILCSFLICMPLAGYYSFARTFVDAAGVLVNDSATFTMSFGQMSEVLFMLVMPLCFVRLGIKWMLAVGMAAWVLRYALFALGADDGITWMILGGVLLHGVCYDFFFVTGMIYVDRKAPKEIRNQAQGFLVLVTQGFGLGVGAKLFFAHVLGNTDDTVIDWTSVWWLPAMFAGVVLVAFVALFRDRVAVDDA